MTAPASPTQRARMPPDARAAEPGVDGGFVAAPAVVLVLDVEAVLCVLAPEALVVAVPVVLDPVLQQGHPVS